MTGDTRQQMIDTAVRLFQRQGYQATSWRALVQAGGTPWGSVQHHFPGGKEQLGVAAVERAGELVDSAMRATLDAAPDPVAGVRSLFTGSAALLAGSGYTAGCPVAPIVLEMAHESDALAAACAAALDRWIETVASELRDAGLVADTAHALATAVLAAFEGALVLSRARRSTAPMERVGDVIAAVVESHLPR